MLDLLIPLIMIGVSIFALARKQDVYSALLDGGRDGLKLIASIVPALVMLLTAVHMLRASGAIDLLTQLLAPLSRVVGIPAETLPLVLIRPFSGSAALAVGSDLMLTYGADSLIGRTAAIMLGSTETTFYTISVYFGAAGVKKTRYAIPAALIADLTGFVMAALCAKYL
ncbi:MAG: spore maturation protein [Oscillospiraceae bacterium]|jgi:spore maturation protein B|nr:spore maturation protein [Oscillospiraceae bacterium]